jgi:hypothetical protein
MQEFYWKPGLKGRNWRQSGTKIKYSYTWDRVHMHSSACSLRLSTPALEHISLGSSAVGHAEYGRHPFDRVE